MFIRDGLGLGRSMVVVSTTLATSNQLLHVPHNNIITDELNYVCVYLPTDLRYAITAV